MAEFPLTVTTVSGKGSALNAVEFDSNLIKTRDCVNDLNERKADKSDLTSHTTNTNNPHNVTAAQLGAANILAQIKTVDGAGSGLDADLLDGKDSKDYRGKIYTGVIGDYRLCVIGLVSLDNTNPHLESWAMGEINLVRNNGASIGQKYFYYLHKMYNSSMCRVSLFGSGGGVFPCTFTYNGIKYGGLQIAPSFTAMFYSGNHLFQNYKGIEPFLVEYYNRNGDIVVNEEVYNSLVVDGSDIRKIKYTFNTGITYDNSGTGLTSTNVQDAITELYNMIQALQG